MINDQRWPLIQTCSHTLHLVDVTNMKYYLQATAMIPNLQFAARHHKECLPIVGSEKVPSSLLYKTNVKNKTNISQSLIIFGQSHKKLFNVVFKTALPSKKRAGWGKDMTTNQQKREIRSKIHLKQKQKEAKLTSISSLRPLPLQLESGLRPLPVPQSFPCSPFFTTRWSLLACDNTFIALPCNKNKNKQTNIEQTNK